MTSDDHGRLERLSLVKEYPLHSVRSTRSLEARMAAALPSHELMSRAGRSVARLSMALAPHAKTVWIACGPGNNGGDGLACATKLLSHPAVRQGAMTLVVTLCANPEAMPADARWALSQARAAGLVISAAPPPSFDLAIDALLGIGTQRPPMGEIADHLNQMNTSGKPVLAVDVPSGLLPDTGAYLGPASSHISALRHTVSLLTLKPGLFTADGRDLAGTVWFDPLVGECLPSEGATAVLSGYATATRNRPHAAHKGSQGDVVVVGGQGIGQGGAGMTGAAVLAARAAIYAGAGRVYVGLLDSPVHHSVPWDPQCPELMFRHPNRLKRDDQLMRSAAVVCGCGGGSAVAAELPFLLSGCHTLVLDADALNRISEDEALQILLHHRIARDKVTVMTPHPLEAARLLGTDTRAIMSDRLAAAQTLSDRFGAICVLKGSGTVVVSPGEWPYINSSGGPALATAGTGDVLAGMIGARLATSSVGRRESPLQAVLHAVHAHGRLADQWTRSEEGTLTAHRLAARLHSD